MRSSLLKVLAAVLALAPHARAQTVLFSDSFENGLSNWTATGLWHVESAAAACGSQAAPFPEGTACAYYGVAGACTYDTGVANSGELTLVTPIALPASGPAASLHCWTRHETETCVGVSSIYDRFDIQISANAGANWTTVGQRCLAKFQAPFVWSPRGIDLSAWLGQSILVRFHFDTVDDFDNAYFGALVDKLEVRLEAGTPECTSGCPCNTTFEFAQGYGHMNGCTNSQQREGELAGSGTPAVSADSVVLNATELVAPCVALLLQADTSGSGAFRGDGRFCLGTNLVRLSVHRASGAAVSFPQGGDPSLSVAGGVPAAGAVRHYQVCYRDTGPWCGNGQYNLTNGYKITWTP